MKIVRREWIIMVFLNKRKASKQINAQDRQAQLIKIAKSFMEIFTVIGGFGYTTCTGTTINVSPFSPEVCSFLE